MPKTNHFARNSLKLTLQAAACLALTTASLSSHALDIVFDYTYDTSSFFDASRKSLMDLAANAFESRLSDNLTAITSGGANSFNLSFFNPADTVNNVTLNNASIAANELRVYVGADDLGSGTLGLGGYGGWSGSGTSTFLNNASSRGQAGALLANETDFGPWGGSISFNSTSNWYFGSGTPVSSGQYDFYSVAVHELGHVLGIGTADSWDTRVSGNNFLLLNNTNVALNPANSHWDYNTQSDVNGVAQEAAMDPDITSGTRKYFTTLDYQGLSAVGWEVTAVPEPETYAMMLLGLGVLGWAGKRRKAA